MEWCVKYEPEKHQRPWAIYSCLDSGEEVYKECFKDKAEAEQWISEKEQHQEYPISSNSKIDEAALESFPASDPPAWTSSTASTAKN